MFYVFQGAKAQLDAYCAVTEHRQNFHVEHRQKLPSTPNTRPFFRVSCRPSTKKRLFTMESQVFPKIPTEEASILSKGCFAFRSPQHVAPNVAHRTSKARHAFEGCRLLPETVSMLQNGLLERASPGL